MIKSTADAARGKALLEHDERIAQRMRGARRSEGKRHSIHREAFLRAVKSEGVEVTGEGGECYWRDMERRYPHLRPPEGMRDDGQSANGRRNAAGRVSRRYRRGRWEQWIDGAWAECEAPESRMIYG